MVNFLHLALRNLSGHTLAANCLLGDNINMIPYNFRSREYLSSFLLYESNNFANFSRLPFSPAASRCLVSPNSCAFRVYGRDVEPDLLTGRAPAALLNECSPRGDSRASSNLSHPPRCHLDLRGVSSALALWDWHSDKFVKMRSTASATAAAWLWLVRDDAIGSWL
jgi:hypothetical protein